MATVIKCCGIMGIHRNSRFGFLERKAVDRNKLREGMWTTGSTRVNGGAIGVHGNPARLTQPGIHGGGPGREERGKACETPGEKEAKAKRTYNLDTESGVGHW